MCGRFTSRTPVDDLVAHFGVDDVVAEERGPRFNVAPTDEVYAVADHRGRRRLGLARWGLVPAWSKGPTSGPPLINARAESILERPAFRSSFERRRCIVPADGFYEWRAGPDGAKQAWHIRPRDGGVLAFAGLWASWAAPTGDRLTSCAIVTTEANPAVARLHDRMPVILPPSAWDEWLEPADDARHLTRLLAPAPADLLEAVAVGDAVNKVGNDGPHLVEPVGGAGGPALSPGTRR